MTKIDHKIEIPGYRIIRKIGEGGMSVVYLAFQESLKREVALKVMRPIVADEENVIKRFEQEAEIIAKLYHPNIVNIYEVGHVDDDVLFYSMPYLQHGDLTSFAYSNDDELKAVLIDVCEGMAYAHTQGVVHRDVKPENILFDQFGNVQIADFGIALSSGRRRFTKDTRIVGSVHYMSPEQAQSKHVDKRSDIYGLGAIIYEILTGDPVFDKDSDLSIMMAHLSDPIPRLPESVKHWQAVIDGCMAKSANQRFQNMDTLKQAITTVKANNSAASKKSKLFVAVFAIMAALFFGVWAVKHFGGNTVEENGFEPNQELSTVVLDKDSPSSEQQTFIDEAGVGEADVGADVGAFVVSEPEAINELSAIEVSELMAQASANIANKKLTTPEDDNALDQILTVLKNIPDHRVALELLSDVMAGYYELLYQAVINSDIQLAEVFATSVAEVRHRTALVDDNLLAELEQNTDMERSLLIGGVVNRVKSAKKSLNHPQAEQYIALLDQVIPGEKVVDELIDSISSMLHAGQVLIDSQGIETVVITPQYNSKNGLLNYGLAVTKSEVTFALYDRFVKSTARKSKRCKSELKANLIFSQRNYSKPGFKVSQNMPVVCVTWHDANQFAAWLSRATDLTYRLPSAREWRHIYKLSNQSVKCGRSNLAGQEFPDKSEGIKLYECDDGSPNVAPVDQFAPNKLGLIGLQGNVSEWLSGCEKLGKFKAIFNPDDLCDNNPVIGRSWISGTHDNGDVKQIDFDQAWTHVGFRLIRDLRNEQ